MKIMEKQDSFRGRGVDTNFAARFKQSDFYQKVYIEHKDEIIVGVRDGHINLYHNCNNIAKISCNTRHLKGEISTYYTDGISGDRKSISGHDLAERYEYIKEQSNKRGTCEKKAQARLFIENNSNPDSEWFCIDIEYAKTAQHGRFDIIAVSKKAPHKVALIELKYGYKALGGNSGIRTHIKDFYNFTESGSFSKLKPEIASIVEGLETLGVNLPASLRKLKEENIAPDPLFYIIVLNNNIEPGNGSTPKQRASGYLFNDKRWGCKRVSQLVKEEGDYFKLTNNKPFPLTFLFSNLALIDSTPAIGISDILNEKFYDKEIISF